MDRRDSENRDNDNWEGAIARLLSDYMGLNPKSIGWAAIAKVVAQAMQQAGFTDLDAYQRHLQASTSALETLVNAIVVPETHFFRHPQSFACLRRYVADTWKARPHHQPLRVLSLPCSTGEEPYSIVITLLEAGLTSQNFQVDAVDISTQALAKAQRGVYEAYAFRQQSSDVPKHLIRHYFQWRQGVYHLDACVRSQVQFHLGNLAKPLCLINHAPYDIIFCRNLLIYFHQTARDRALLNLDRLLVPNGLLFLGYAETNQIDLDRFAPLHVPQAFGYRKLPKWTASLSAPTAVVPISSSTTQSLSSKPLPSDNPPLNDRVVSSTQAPTIKPVPIPSLTTRQESSEKDVNSPELVSQSNLEEIRKLADSGVLAAALEQCDRYLQIHPTSAAGYLLLGEIYQAQKADDRAKIAFQKALYLNPDYEEALIHLWLLSEQQGHQALAQRLRQRLERLTTDI